ncbi:glycosyltransferase [Sediminibacterium sp.]|uniref:glycosyltransferase n=1 Tax=Sediminibacterium sp. TaxID=1917865 RepID=UPI003F6A2523
MNEFYYENKEIYRKFILKEKITSLYFRFMSYWAIKTSLKIIVPTDSIMQEAITRFPRYISKLSRIYESSDFDSQTTDLADQGFKRVVKIIYVGGFYRHKGQLRFIQFIKQLLRIYPGLNQTIELTFHGHVKDVEYFKECESESRTLSIPVSFSSYSKEKSLAEIYSDHEICVSFSEYEGFGLPVIEAQSLGIAVCCSNLPVFCEILGNSAVILDLKDLKASLSRFQNLILNSAFRNSIRESGAENCKKFSWKNTASETYTLYFGLPNG